MKILVVDDERVVRHVCQLSLERDEFEVLLAENGIAALEILRHDPTIEIVLSDMKMPGINGMELLQEIRRDFPFIEVIIMTAHATVEIAVAALKLGAYDFLLKPLKSEQIRLSVAKCREKIRLSSENYNLRMANERLRDLQRMKNKFIAIISHELRTPVSHLQGFHSILADRFYYQLSEPEQHQCLEVMKTAITELEQIVTDMMDLINFENKNWLLRKERLNLTELTSAIVGEYRIPAEQRNIRMTWQPVDNDSFILGDRMKIKIVLAELLQNAIKYTADGGHIEVRLENDDVYWIVSVKDSGVGIAPDELGKIFEKFYEVQNSENHSSSKLGFMGGGLGVGLSISRAIAQAHGGVIKVDSHPGAGSTFRVLLPRCEAESPHGEIVEANTLQLV